MMTSYELLYIIPAKFTPTEIQTLIKKIDGVVSTAGATLTGTHHLGKRRLEYPIAHTRYGEYVLSYFDAETGIMNKLNDTLRLSTDLMRHIIVKRNPLVTGIPVYVENEERRRPSRDEEQPRPRPVAPAVPKESMTMEELDKKLDKILTEDSM